jgi:hypothetical protein
VSDGRLIRSGHSPAFLPEDGALRRLPRVARKPRPPEFFERFEDRTLVYDCFRHADGSRILLVGPPPMNLMPQFKAAQFLALPSRRQLRAAYHASLSTMITELTGAPAGTNAVQMTLDGQVFELLVQPSHAADFAGRRVLFTMSKDNELGWIAEWARWHAALHGTDAIVLFDNGSGSYGVGEIEQTLLGVDGIERVAVVSWPGAFGATDPALAINPYWAHFLQIASMSVVLRRFGAGAFGLLNCDVDELAATHSGRPIYDLLAEAWRGLVTFRGQWVEPLAEGGENRSHRVFSKRLADPAGARSGPSKWVLDPKRDWVQRLGVHPYWHWVHGRPWFGKTMPADAFYRHFKGINTNWKERRTDAGAGRAVETDRALVAAFARIGGDV